MDSKQFVEPKLNTQHLHEQLTEEQIINISSPTITSTIAEEHNLFTSFVQTSSTTNVIIDEKDSEIISIDNTTENSQIIEFVDLNEERRHFNEPYVTLKHRNIESKNAIENTVAPLSMHNFEKANSLTKNVTTLIENELSIRPLKKDKDNFVVEVINENDMEKEKGKSILKSKPIESATSETIESQLRPRIFVSEFKCKFCTYNTKVRFNMQQHLQQHIAEKAVPETATLNPVSCLKKTEKICDDKSKLASSSHHEQIGGKVMEKMNKENKDDKIYPGFVPVSKRFVCGALNCNYLTHGDQMLRHHLTSVHTDDTVYKCPHCQIDIPSKIHGLEIDKILSHLEMHDLHLYKCPNCQFFHYQKSKIEKHICENHRNTDENCNKNIVIIRELDNTVNLNDDKPILPINFVEQIATNVDAQQLWRCGHCTSKCQSRNEIQNHSDTQHGVKPQFKCFKCKYESSAKTNSIGHVKKAHSQIHGEPEIETSYYKEQEAAASSFQDNTNEVTSPLSKQTFDITPLRVENKSKEETSDSESDTRSEDMSNSPLKLHCKYCDFVSKTTKTLRKHQRSHYMNYSYKCKCCNYALQVISQNKAKQVSATEKLELLLKRKRPSTEENEINPAKIFEKNEKEIDLITIDKETTTTTSTTESVMINGSNIHINYGCLLCSKKSNELDEIRSHFFETHSCKKFAPFKYKKVIMDKSKTLHYKCKYCEWISDRKSVKQHYLKIHNDKTSVPLRNTKLKCTICAQSFPHLSFIKKHFNVQHLSENLSFHTLLEDGMILDRTEYLEEKQILFICYYCCAQFGNKTELINHHTLLHSNLQFKETQVVLSEEEQDLRRIECPEYGHSSNPYRPTRQHLINDLSKPLQCSHCNTCFNFPVNLKNHHFQKHGDLPLIINKVPKFTKQIDKITGPMLHSNEEGTFSTKNKLKRSNNIELDEPPTKILVLDGKLVTNPSIKRNVAKKSTSNRPKNLEFSFYGTKPCNMNDYKNVMSEIEIMDKVMRINVVAMSHILNLSPMVQLMDIKNQISL